MGASAQTTIRVPLHYPTIQEAINAAANGDTVLVAPGTYIENINFAGKAITVTSEAGPEVTLIDGNRVNSVVKFMSGEGRSSVLSGFTVWNGRSRYDIVGSGNGGGVTVEYSSPTITGNIIVNNRGCVGAGISIHFGSPLIQRNTITNNRLSECTGDGGGISIGGASSAQVLDNIIADNFAPSGSGGGIALYSAGTPTIRGNIISGNTATGLSPCASGGGISIEIYTSAYVAENAIVGNTAGCGAGVSWDGAPGVSPLLANNTIADNNGPGVSLQHPSEMVFVNNIVLGKAGHAAIVCANPSGLNPPAFRFNNVLATSGTAYGGTCNDQSGINGNISSDPMFVDQAGGNYRVLPSSQSIDAGDNTVAGTPSLDLGGNARIVDGDGNGTVVIDIGAYEYATLLTPASHDFGYLTLGSTPVSKIFAIFNAGANPLTINSISIGDRLVGAGSPADFSVTSGGENPCPSLTPTLASGHSCTVAVVFATPPTLGRKGATLKILLDSGSSTVVAALNADVVVDTSITSSPSLRTVSSAATFTFVSNAEGSAFECKISSGAYSNGFFPCVSPVQFDVSQGEYTFQVRAVSIIGAADPTPATYIWTIVQHPIRADFDGNRRADVLWRNSATGENYLYPMNGTAILGSEGYLRTVADLNWQIAGIGDFDGDGKADVLWRNSATGQNYIYFMDGTTIKPTEGYIRTVADQNWQIAGVGDFNGDGIDDIVWRNSATGENYIYPMDGRTILGTEGYIRTVADQNWQIAGVGDFDRDSKADVLWRNSSTGQNYIYFMDGIAIKPDEGYIRTVADQNWQVAGVGDFDGDGSSDILWRNAATGENYMYPMDGKTILGQEGYLRTVADQSWQVKGTGDYDGDGNADVLWRNSVSGENYLYPMVGTTIKPTEGYLRTVVDQNWQVQNPK